MEKRHIIQILAEERANVVLWPGRASGTVFGCGAGSMLLGILLLTPVRVRLERLSAASWWMLTALLFIYYYFVVVVAADESIMNV